MLPAIAYIRLATKLRPAACDNLSGQKSRLSAYAKQRGIRVARWFMDDSSARDEDDSGENPEFDAACALAVRKGWPIIVVDADCFSAADKSLRHFIDAGGKIYDLSGFGGDEAEMTQKINHAKKVGADRSKATKKGQDEAKAAGKKFGAHHPKNGAKASAISRGKEADIHRRELEALRDEAAKDGVTSAKEFADWLNRRGYLTARGRRWTAASVRARAAARPGSSGAGPILAGIDFVNAGEELVSLTAAQVVGMKDLLLAPQNDALRSIVMEFVERPTRQLRDSLVAKVQALQEVREIREALETSDINPNWGIF